MVLEPLSAIGLGASIVQFVQFGTGILSKTNELYKSADGVLKENILIEVVVKNLKILQGRIKVAGPIASPDFSHLRDESLELADDLLKALEDLKVKGTQSRWKSLRKALKAVRSKEKIQKWLDSLRMLREEYSFHVQGDLRETANKIDLQQSQRFQNLEARQQDSLRSFISALHDGVDQFADIIVQNTKLIEAHITAEHEATRLSCETNKTETLHRIRSEAEASQSMNAAEANRTRDYVAAQHRQTRQEISIELKRTQVAQTTRLLEANNENEVAHTETRATVIDSLSGELRSTENALAMDQQQKMDVLEAEVFRVQLANEYSTQSEHLRTRQIVEETGSRTRSQLAIGLGVVAVALIAGTSQGNSQAQQLTQPGPSIFNPPRRGNQTPGRHVIVDAADIKPGVHEAEYGVAATVRRGTEEAIFDTGKVDEICDTSVESLTVEAGKQRSPSLSGNALSTLPSATLDSYDKVTELARGLLREGRRDSDSSHGESETDGHAPGQETYAILPTSRNEAEATKRTIPSSSEALKRTIPAWGLKTTKSGATELQSLTETNLKGQDKQERGRFWAQEFQHKAMWESSQKTQHSPSIHAWVANRADERPYALGYSGKAETVRRRGDLVANNTNKPEQAYRQDEKVRLTGRTARDSPRYRNCREAARVEARARNAKSRFVDDRSARRDRVQDDAQIENDGGVHIRRSNDKPEPKHWRGKGVRVVDSDARCIVNDSRFGYTGWWYRLQQNRAMYAHGAYFREAEMVSDDDDDGSRGCARARRSQPGRMSQRNDQHSGSQAEADPNSQSTRGGAPSNPGWVPRSKLSTKRSDDVDTWEERAWIPRSMLGTDASEVRSWIHVPCSKLSKEDWQQVFIGDFVEDQEAIPHRKVSLGGEFPW